MHEKEHHKQGHRHMTVLQALHHPKVLLLAAAYFFVVTASYGVEFFLPKILENWYDLPLSDLTWFLLIPPVGGLVGQLSVGWSSDRTGERRLARLGADLPGGCCTWLHVLDPHFAFIQYGGWLWRCYCSPWRSWGSSRTCPRSGHCQA